MSDQSVPPTPDLISTPDSIKFKPMNDREREVVSSSSIQESNVQSKDEPAVHISHRYYVLLAIFTMICYSSLVGSISICSQYIYYRISLKNGVPDGGLNTNKSSSICFINTSGPNISYISNLTAISQEESAMISMQSNLASGIPLVFLVVIYGAYSDRMGRKLTIIISWLGFMSQMVIHCLFIYLDWPIWTYILGSFTISLGGSFASMLSAIFSIAADTTTKKQRSLVIGLLECSLGIAIVIAMMVVGEMIEQLGFKLTILLMTAFFLSSGLCLFFIPETLPSKISPLYKTSQSRRGFENPAQLIKSIINMYIRDSRRGILIMLLCISIFFVFVGEMGSMSVNTLYFMNQPFCFSSSKMGIFNGIKSGVQQFVAIILLILLKNRFSSVTFTLVGFISEIAKLFLIAFASFFHFPISNYILYSAIPAGMLSGFLFPFLRSLASQTVDVHEQGVVFASIGTLESLGVLMGTVTLSAIYNQTVHYFPGLIYFITTILSVLGFFLTILFVILRRRYSGTEYKPLLNDNIS